MGVKTFNVSLPAELVETIDIQARLSYATRSEYIKQAVVTRLVAEGVFDDAFWVKDKKKLLRALKRAQLKRYLIEHRKAYPISQLEDIS
jgi:hypothetical protein